MASDINKRIPSSERLEGIQALRGIAAIFVVVDHAISALIQKAGLDPGYETFAWSLGNVGVAVFFVISGFIMIHTADLEFGAHGAPRRFFTRRLWRVGPLYWLVTFIQATKLLIDGTPPAPSEIAASLLFVPYIDGNGLMRPIYPVGWTLNFEMYFYLFFAIALSLDRKIGLSFIFFVLSLPVAIGVLSGIQDPSHGMMHGFLYFVCHPLILYFLAGILLGLARKKSGSRPGAALIGFATLAALVTTGQYVQSTGSLKWFIWLVPVTLVVFAFASLRTLTPSLRPPGLILGNASYSIYLTHNFALGPYGNFWGKYASSFGAPLFIIGAIIGCSSLGIMVHYLIEKPIAKLGHSSSAIQTSGG
ncbi:acyltransferase [Rhizobium sp. RU36D]|uniref:acyltransferase family protein n=1 Tax=Rhizobium sp. RU36D TaxID=1907415 RepID=UPI0009D905C8|nr:acyltransferase [Rhizobium sp. RU36D]SMD20708.1 Peptidoglycan/LPS O-acetylase OafA/YrhL, contains acyltransferase and SGNH-hydrolase domains [Rhizobium sp. RU36D]